MGKIKDLTGKKFGRLSPFEFFSKNQISYWKCKCDCGNEHIARQGDLHKEHVSSCGCLRYPEESIYKEKTKQRILNKSKWNGECLEWIGPLDSKGYGMTSYTPNKKRSIWKTSRLIFFLENGDIPKGMCICHKCDNPKCLNINHLFLGTHKDNAQDRVSKGRDSYRKGLKNGRAKLNEAQVRSIRNDFDSGTPIKDLCKKFKVSHVLLYKITKNKLWSHI